MTDRITRSAMLWATVVAVPVTVLVGALVFAGLSGRSAAAPQPAGPAAPTTVAAVPSAPVVMAAPALPARAASVCREIIERLPAAVRDLPRRPVSAGREQNAAYGEPALTVACGVPQPPLCPSLDETNPGCVPLDTELLTMNRVCWYADRSSTATTFTTMNADVAVRVSVPTGYEQPAQWANEFSVTVTATVRPKTSDVPTGCS